ncbi:tautomerase family protein [Amycolatopsis sp. NPDC004368]
MPFVDVKLVEGCSTEEEKHALAAALTDVMVKPEGSEAFRALGLDRGTAHRRLARGGRPVRGAASLLGNGSPVTLETGVPVTKCHCGDLGHSWA